MNRRTFMQAVAAVGSALGFNTHPTGDRTYGYVDVDRAIQEGWFKTARVFLDGVDVSRQCFACDDTKGMVWIYKRNSEGAHYIDWDTQHTAVGIKRGHVKFSPYGAA